METPTKREKEGLRKGQRGPQGAGCSGLCGQTGKGVHSGDRYPRCVCRVTNAVQGQWLAASFTAAAQIGGIIFSSSLACCKYLTMFIKPVRISGVSMATGRHTARESPV